MPLTLFLYQFDSVWTVKVTRKWILEGNHAFTMNLRLDHINIMDTKTRQEILGGTVQFCNLAHILY